MTRRFEHRFHCNDERHEEISDAYEQVNRKKHREPRRHSATERPDHLVRRSTDINSLFHGKLVNQHGVPVDWTLPKLFEPEQDSVEPLHSNIPPAAIEYSNTQRIEIAETLAAHIVAKEIS
jgi:hypothetical protein